MLGYLLKMTFSKKARHDEKVRTIVTDMVCSDEQLLNQLLTADFATSVRARNVLVARGYSRDELSKLYYDYKMSH